ncbi:MAG: glycosyltransferase [Leptolyngbyaceae cyanobacterium]
MSTKVSICISTYKRPEGLTRLVNGINDLEFETVEVPDIEILVADNDKAGSAQAIYQSLKETSRWPLTYSVEPQQGVTYARNHSVRMASDQSEFLVFIDDDEVPSRLWLDRLLSTQAEHQADIVTGPVYPKFESNQPPQWVTKGGFFVPGEQGTATPVSVAFTNNVLVKTSLVKPLREPFDHRFAFRGSEDAYLFMSLYKQGAVIIWNDEAFVYEFIPETRTRIKWLLDSAYFGWSSHSVVERELFPSLKKQGVRLVKGILSIIYGALRTIPSLFLGKHELVKSLVYCSRGYGTLSGLVGVHGGWGGTKR